MYSCEGQKSLGLWGMVVFTSLWGQEATNLASSESLDSAIGHAGTYQSTACHGTMEAALSGPGAGGEGFSEVDSYFWVLVP